MQRVCGTCTKCCDGTLSGEIKGHDMYPGKPCHFLKIGTGCTIYKDRPEEPCKRYECSWISNLDIPEFMKPELSNCILDYREIMGLKYLRLSECEYPYSKKVLDWCLNYAKSNNYNIIWYINKNMYYSGTKEFEDICKYGDQTVVLNITKQ